MDHIKYRPDIDGLRAVAILLVVLFHAFPSVNFLQGGFIGVDVFFVISGFLITSIIKDGIARQNFSLTRFYLNRIRRIFPALITILICLGIFAWIGLFAEELKQLGLHFIGAASFTTNFILNNQAGYFDTQSITKPLLHLWSLSIEEQFYLFWPVLLWILIRFNCALYVVPIIFIASLLGQYHEQKINVTSSFYLPQFRFWELLAGSMIALMIVRLRQKLSTSQAINELISIVGLLLILLGASIYCKANSSVSYMLIFPVIGACMLILSSTETWVNKKLLSNKSMVALGLISYPLYLWHWPILALDKMIFNVEATMFRQVCLILLAGFLAYLTYIFVEKPLRFSIEKKSKYVFLILAMIFIGFFGWRCFDRGGYPHRSGTSSVNKIGEVGHESFLRYLQENYKTCDPSSLGNLAVWYQGRPRCYQSKVGVAKNVVILGDSHAEQLFPGIANELSQKNVIYFNNAGLPFTSDDHYAKLYDWIAHDENVSTVIYSLYWVKKLNGVNLDDFVLRFSEALQLLKKSGKKIILLDDVPNFSFDPKECKYKRMFGRTKCIEEGYFLEEAQFYRPLLKEVALNAGVDLIDLSHLFCYGAYCQMTNENILLYRDDNHLNVEGSNFVARALSSAHVIP